MSDATDLPQDPLTEAAEYVLGLLEPEAARAFERRMADDPELEQEVVAWSAYFATLTDDIPAVAPPPQVLRRIETTLWGGKAVPFWRQLLPYVVGGALAALVLAVFTPGEFSGRSGDLYAELDAQAQGYALLAHWAPDSQTLMLRRDAGEFPTDGALEIWLIAGPQATPVSVGLLQPDVLTRIAVADAQVADMRAGATIAISLEPPGGSPTGAPTGPVLAAAALELRG